MDYGAPCIAERLASSSARRFVGRSAELDLFRLAVSAEVPPFSVLHVHGAGGIGKTALLHEYARFAAAAGRPVCRVDARNLEVSPPAFVDALRYAWSSGGSGAFEAAQEWPAGGVLLLDTYEMIWPLDGWLRDVFLHRLPNRSLVVIAGRKPPVPEWESDPAWAALTQILSLRPLAPEECRAYLCGQGVPAARFPPIEALAHGHPLLLAVIADMVRIGALTEPLRLEQQPDALHTLLQRLLDHVPSTSHRRALGIAAIARTTTEALLVDVLGEEAGAACFEWLRGLSFIEHGAHGVFPHDSVRELLDADWRWRNPGCHAEFRGRVVAHLRRAFALSAAAERPRLRQENMFVRRRDPGMEPYFAWDKIGRAHAEAATGDDAPIILGMVARHQGEASAAIARYWLARQPRAFNVFRMEDGSVCGFMANLELEDFAAEDLTADPAIAAARTFVDAHGPLRSGEAIIYLRFWMDREAHQVPSPAVNLTAASSVSCWLTHPRLSWNFIAIANPPFWEPHFTSIDIRRSPDADFEVGGCRYGVFAHDWRVEPPAEWERRRLVPVAPAAPGGEQASQRFPDLSRPEFEAALRRALRNYTRPTLLAANPLLHTCIAEDSDTGEASPTVLKARLKEAVALLDGNPKDHKLYRAVWHTCFEPETTQELAAEKLGLPFSTYRYHLSKGIERIASTLWQCYSAGRSPTR